VGTLFARSRLAQDAVVEAISKRRSLAVLAWSTSAVSLALFVGALILAQLGDSDLGGFGAVWMVSLATFALVGGLISARRPENPIGWIF